MYEDECVHLSQFYCKKDRTDIIDIITDVTD